MSIIFAERETSCNAKFHDPGLSWMHGLAHPSTMPNDLHIHLKAHRKLRKLSQEQIANMIGVKHNTVSGWETGSRQLDLIDLKKLADLYGVHPAVLLLAPEDGPRFDAMRRASQLAERMGPEVAGDWLRMGERLAPPSEKK